MRSLALTLLLAGFSLTFGTAAQAGDCDSLKAKYSDSLDAVKVASDFVQGQLEKIGTVTGNPLVDSKIEINVLEEKNTPDSGFSRLSFDGVTATYADGRVLKLCSALQEGACARDSEARFSWDLTRTDSYDDFGTPNGYTCQLRSFPTPFPYFLNEATGRRVFELTQPSGLLVTESH